MINLIVMGTTGRMSSRIVALARTSTDLTLVAAVGKNDSLEDVLGRGQVIVDFTLPEPTLAHVALAAAKRVPIVIGTTGLSDAQQKMIANHARSIPIVLAPNMSVGVNVLAALVDVARRTLGQEYTAHMLDVHHVHKRDAPSGTAKMLQAVMEKAQPGSEIPIRSVREGEVVGDHTISFSNGAETIELTHRAHTRDIFAQGALTAARWIVGKPAGLYTMMDVLGLRP